MSQPPPRRPHLASFGGFVVTFSLAAAAWSQSAPRPPREVPWQPDQGAGSLTEPGPSRLLPPIDEGSIPSERVAARLPNVAQGDRSLSALPHAPRDNGQVPPEQWWKEEAEKTLVDPEQGPHGRGVSPRGEIILSTQILAMVGSQPILAGDLLSRINEMLKPVESQYPEEELDQQRWLLMERMLPAAIEAKLVFLDFTRPLEAAQLSMIQTNVFQQFDDKQLPELVERAGVRSAAELDAKMRVFGSSLDSVRRGFFEQVAAREMIRKHGEDESEVTHDQLLAYYQEHLADYEIKARARWEHMMVRFDRFDSKREAFQALGVMGNSVLRGTPFEVVARRDSQGPRADLGGEYDWTQQGSLASKVLDHAVFSLPVGVLSDRLEDDHGFHIVRVIERKEAGRVPFLDAQIEIRDKIKEQRRDAKVKEYLERLKRETYVWNHFEES